MLPNPPCIINVVVARHSPSITGSQITTMRDAIDSAMAYRRNGREGAIEEAERNLDSLTEMFARFLEIQMASKTLSEGGLRYVLSGSTEKQSWPDGSVQSVQVIWPK